MANGNCNIANAARKTVSSLKNEANASIIAAIPPQIIGDMSSMGLMDLRSVQRTYNVAVSLLLIPAKDASNSKVWHTAAKVFGALGMKKISSWCVYQGAKSANKSLLLEANTTNFRRMASTPFVVRVVRDKLRSAAANPEKKR